MMTKRLVLMSLTVLLAFSAIFGTILLSPSAKAASFVSLSSLKAGDLIRGESYTAVYYYGTDGFRYVFPNDKTYFTWYTNFNAVKWVTDADLTKIQIGGNVTYRPGARMIKINSDPRVYVVAKGGLIRAINSETIAKSLYGATWNKQIDDVPDGFFSNYKLGGTIDDASMFSPTSEKAEASDINTDKALKSAVVVSITDSGYSPSSVSVKAGTAVRFVNNGTTKHTASDDAGDWGTGTLNPGDTFSKYFKTSGSFNFHDAYGSAKASLSIE
jgi:plastocyanin